MHEPNAPGGAPAEEHASIWRNLRALPRNLKRTIFRHGYPDSERDRSLTITSNFVLHTHSVHTHENSLRPGYTLGLGVIATSLFIILCVTGVVLMLFYVPSTEEAYDRIRDLRFMVAGGQVMRNLHRWGAHAMVAVVFLHMARVFYTASYRAPREFNWLLGLALLVVTLGLSFTGYLLPWDQLAFWAITIGSNIARSPQELTDALGITRYFDPGGMIKRLLLGGNQVGQDALLRFYVLHCVILPGVAAFLVGLHFWRIRKDGGLSRPADADRPPGLSAAVEPEAAPAEAAPTEAAPTEAVPLRTYSLMALPKRKGFFRDTRPESTVTTWPTTVIWEVTLFMLTCAAMVLLAMAFDAPLKELANAAVPENPAKAPWYFLGLQELVSYSAFAGGMAIPTVTLLGLALIPFLDRERAGTGIWFTSGRGRRVALWSALGSTIFLVALLAFTVRFGWLREWSPSVPQIVIILINPGTVIVLAYALVSLAVARGTGSPRMGAISLFTMFLCGFVILTIMGVYFRGPNWHFYWSPSHWPGG